MWCLCSCLSNSFPTSEECIKDHHGHVNTADAQVIVLIYGCQPKNRDTPKPSILIGFSIIFTIHLGCLNPPIFGSTPLSQSYERSQLKKFRSFLGRVPSTTNIQGQLADGYVRSGRSTPMVFLW